MKTQTESSRFLDLARRVVSVPKAEIDKRDAVWKKARKTAKTKK
jgi:hypothetical protein